MTDSMRTDDGHQRFPPPKLEIQVSDVWFTLVWGESHLQQVIKVKFFIP